MSITVYTFEDRDGDEWGSFTTQNYPEARTYAQQNKLRLVANEFEWSEAVPVEGHDYTEAEERHDDDRSEAYR